MIGHKVKYSPNVDKTKDSIIMQEFKDKYSILDSGQRKVFKTGMQRDSEDKIRYDLIPLFMINRFARHLTLGAKKYNPRNWEKAETPEELDRFIQSAWRHWIQLLENETTEDHFSALIFNLCGIEMVRAKLKEGN